MASHVRILAWFHLIVSSLGILLALLVFAGGSMLPSILDAVGGEASELPVAVIHLIVVVVTGIIAALSLPGLVLGYGLYNLRSWARIFGIVMAAFHLLNVPLGTALSIYTFWVLLKPETEALFRTGRA